MKRALSFLKEKRKLIVLAGIPGALFVPQMVAAQDGADPLETAMAAATGVNFVWVLIAGFLIFFM